MILEKPIQYNREKHQSILERHALDIDRVMQDGILLKHFPHHPNQEKYPNQQVFIIAYDSYPVFVPFVEEDEYIFIKNCIPKREYKFLLP